MSNVKSRKLCWNCEGSVHIHAPRCPYCGTDLGGEGIDAKGDHSGFDERDEGGVSLEEAVASESIASLEPEVVEESSNEPTPEAGGALRAVALPMLLLLPGAFFVLFGLVLLLFSENGVLTLSWNAGYWYVYWLLASPLIYFGWKTLSR